MADEVLEKIEDVDAFSFYGLVHWLGEVGKLVERADAVALLKAPKAADLELKERKEELLDAQARLRRAMGSSLERPSLTKRERPLAEGFLKDQLSKLAGQAKRDERAAKGVERLQEILATVQRSPVVADSKAVRDLEAAIKQANADWKELSPTYDKWEAGRHSFKSNADLQAFKRRYEECKKLRETSEEKLEKALCERRSGAERPPVDNRPAPGWAAVAKKAAGAPPPRPANSSRGATAMALDSAAKRRAAPKGGGSSWGSAAVSFAQRLRAEVVAKVRNEGEEAPEEQADEPVEPMKDDDDDDPFWEEDIARQRPAPPPPPPKALTKAKAAAPGDGFVAAKAGGARPSAARAQADLASLANSRRRWGPAPAAEEVEEEEEEEEEVAAAAPAVSSQSGGGGKASFNASAKKKSKSKKKKGSQQDSMDDSGTASAEVSQKSPASVPAWAKAVEAAFSGTVIQDLLRPSAWGAGEAADERLEELLERLPLSSPLGLVLPLTWTEFMGLEIDGGPKRTSRRGTSPWVLRLQTNVPWLIAHYLTLLFFLALLHAFSHFGLLMWFAAVQTALLLLPTGQLPQLGARGQVLALQVAHLLLCAFFMRSLWQMHLFVKIFVVLMVAGHAYVVAEVADVNES